MESYRFYTMARHAFSTRSGIFSLNEFCDILHTEHGYTSLHNRPGNKRKKYKNKLHSIFTDSILFRQASDGRFIINAERDLLKQKASSDKSSWYEIPEKKILSSKGSFNDFCIGVILAGNRFRANRSVAESCHCSVRRIQLATSKNHKNLHFAKQFNFIDDYTGTKKQIEKIRAQLFAIHGISSPRAFRYKDVWVLRLNAPNSYKTFVLSGVKGFCSQPTGVSVRMEKCWFKPVHKRNVQPSLFGEGSRKWMFNEAVYDFDKYIADNSSYLN